MGCCESVSVNSEAQVISVRHKWGCFKLSKRLIPEDKVIYIHKTTVYRWFDIWMILLTVGLYYCLCMDSGLRFGLSNGEDFDVRLNKREASQLFKKFGERIFKDKYGDDEDAEPGPPYGGGAMELKESPPGYVTSQNTAPAYASPPASI